MEVRFGMRRDCSPCKHRDVLGIIATDSNRMAAATRGPEAHGHSTNRGDKA